MKLLLREADVETDVGRAPQGARGLKLLVAAVGLLALLVAPRKGCVG